MAENLDFTSIFVYVISGIGIVIIAIFAIRFAFKFDVNKWLERKDEKATIRLRNTCPHMSVEYDNKSGGFKFDSFFVSPSMTTDWVCKQCGIVIPSELMIPKYPTNLKEIEEVIEAQKKFIKLAEKAGIL